MCLSSFLCKYRYLANETSPRVDCQCFTEAQQSDKGEEDSKQVAGTDGCRGAFQRLHVDVMLMKAVSDTYMRMDVTDSEPADGYNRPPLSPRDSLYCVHTSITIYRHTSLLFAACVLLLLQ
jgi:hypothetical protein